MLEPPRAVGVMAPEPAWATRLTAAPAGPATVIPASPPLPPAPPSLTRTESLAAGPLLPEAAPEIAWPPVLAPEVAAPMAVAPPVGPDAPELPDVAEPAVAVEEPKMLPGMVMPI